MNAARSPTRPYESAEAAAFAAIVRSSQDAVIAKTLDGTVTAWNDGATAIYGYTAVDMLGRNIEITIPVPRLAEERERHLRAAQGLAESGVRCTRLRKDGQALEVVMTMSPVRDDQGQVIGVASISRPVSSTEQADARFASLLDAAPDPIICVDQAGRIVIANAQVSACFGYENDELLGAEVEMLLPEGLRDLHRRHREQFVTNPEVRQMGACLGLVGLRRDGSTLPVEVSLAPIVAGGDALVIAVIRDVSRQRRLELSLRESENRLRELAESVDIMFILLRLNPVEYLYVSPGSRTVIGVEPADLMADPARGLQMLHPDDEELAVSWFDDALSGLPVRSEHRIVTREGEIRWLRTVATPVPNPTGPVERTVITVDNISDRVAADEALRNAESAARVANEAKNQFLSRMSHELRTPLNAVLGFGQLLSRQLADTQHADAIGYIIKGGRHLLDLINDVLDIARIEAGEMSVSPEPVILASIIEETLHLMEPLAEESMVVFVAMLGNTTDAVLADRQRLRQILLNLLSNAIKYNHRGGHVWIGWHSDVGGISVTVRDDGNGVPIELQGRLFTPFDRLGAESSGIDGTGIGLALSRSLAERMGGAITVESIAGEGSCFTVSLPIAPAGDELAVTRLASPALLADDPARSSQGVLLYIEDNEPNVRVIEHLLRLRPGWRMIHAALGQLGCDLAQAHQPDLVLLDLHLPDLGGLEVLRMLKSDPVTGAIPVVVITADASVDQPRRLLVMGAERFLTKPLDIDEILAVLDDVAAQRGGRNDARPADPLF